jgi:hypothetical protein
MNIKQFLKPNWRKILLSLILFLSIFYAIDFIFSNSFGVLSFIVLLFFISIFYVSKNPSNHENYVSPESLIDLISFIIISLIISYLLSCLIVWVYDKVKKKK